MSDNIVTVAVVGMVCVAIGAPVVLAIYTGSNFTGRASKNGIELSTKPDKSKGKLRK